MSGPQRVSLLTDDGVSLPDLSAFTATDLQTDTGGVLHVVQAHGAAVLTRHKRPTFVVLTVERYLQLEKAASRSREGG